MSALLSLKEAAEYLAMSESCLRRLVRRKVIKYHKPPSRWGRIKFRREWLDDWIEAGAVAPVTPTTSKPKPQLAIRPVGHSDTSHGLSYALLRIGKPPQ